MRTLKKVLALTVALATLFSLTAFAAFTDEDQINESLIADINLMGALNVMTGDTEGTFRPNDTISRAEAAKMIYVIRNGGDDDKAIGWVENGLNAFTDVLPGIWYEGYVNYCASLGIIAGDGKGNFNPNGQVTGVELAKMLLVVAGYKPDVQGYTGANWAMNVIEDAQLANIFDDYGVAYGAAAPRQWAAKLFSNAILKTEMAVYFNGELVNGLSLLGPDATTVGEKYFSMDTVTGVLTGTGKVGLSVSYDEDAGYTFASSVENTPDGKTSAIQVEKQSCSFTYEAPVELLGQEVTVVYKETGNNNDLDSKDTIYSVYATGASSSYETTLGAVTVAANTEDGYESIKFEGYNGDTAKAYDDGKKVVLVTDYHTGSVLTAASGTPAFTELAEGNSNRAIQFVDVDSDGYFELAFVNTVRYGKVDTYNVDKHSLKVTDVSGGSTISATTQANFDKYTVVDDIEADDIVKITTSYENGAEECTVELADSFTGTVEKISSSAVTVNGSAYKLSAQKLNSLSGLPAASNIGEELTFYTDGAYLVFFEGKAAEAPSNIAVIVDASNEDGSGSAVNFVAGKVQLLTSDNAKKVYTMVAEADLSNTEDYILPSAVESSKDVVVEYILNDDNEVMLKKLPTEKVGDTTFATAGTTSTTYDADTGIAKVGSSSFRTTSETVVFVKSTTDGWAAVKASELGSISEAAQSGTQYWAYTTTSGINYLVYATTHINVAVPGASATEDYAITNGTPYTTGKFTESGLTSFYKVMLPVVDSNGEALELVAKSSTGTAVDNFVNQKLFVIETDSKGVTTLTEVTLAADKDDAKANNTWVLGSVVGDDATTLFVNAWGTEDMLTKADDVQVIYVDLSGDDLVVDGTIAIPEVEGTTNVLFKLNSSGNVTDIIVETNGDDILPLITYKAAEEIAPAGSTTEKPDGMGADDDSWTEGKMIVGDADNLTVEEDKTIVPDNGNGGKPWFNEYVELSNLPEFVTIERTVTKELEDGTKTGTEVLTYDKDNEAPGAVKTGDEKYVGGLFGRKSDTAYLKLGTFYDGPGTYTNSLVFKDEAGRVVATSTWEVDLTNSAIAESID